MDKNICCVSIPIHNPDPSPYELISFEQCFKVLGRYPIKVIAPYQLDLGKYRKIIPDFEVIYIDAKWQSSLSQYNKLKISSFFYELFKQYNYLLTYELDAFVFKDELLEWCNKGYDYIGAPWFEGFDKADPDAMITGVGNSGFSLRNVQSVLKVLGTFYVNPAIYHSGKLNFIKASIKYPYRKIISLVSEKYRIQWQFKQNEDLFFSKLVPLNFSYFKIAPISEAISFSFEVNPSKLYELNDHRIPFGCHAWWRYDLQFWKPYIQSYGYSI